MEEDFRVLGRRMPLLEWWEELGVSSDGEEDWRENPKVVVVVGSCFPAEVEREKVEAGEQ